MVEAYIQVWSRAAWPAACCPGRGAHGPPPVAAAWVPRLTAGPPLCAGPLLDSPHLPLVLIHPPTHLYTCTHTPHHTQHTPAQALPRPDTQTTPQPPTTRHSTRPCRACTGCWSTTTVEWPPGTGTTPSTTHPWPRVGVPKGPCRRAALPIAPRHAPPQAVLRGLLSAGSAFPPPLTPLARRPPAALLSPTAVTADHTFSPPPQNHPPLQT